MAEHLNAMGKFDWGEEIVMPFGLNMPPTPPWEGMHPLVVHFPIALVFVVPAVILAALVYPRGRHGLVLCSLGMAIAGTAFLWVASATGEAAFDHAVAVDGAQDILVNHEHMAERARNYFTVLTAFLVAAVIFSWWKMPKPKPVLRIGVTLVYVALHGIGIAMLSNAAHQGGRLVHEVGVRSVMAGATTQP